jgi:hypothetical protein
VKPNVFVFNDTGYENHAGCIGVVTELERLLAKTSPSLCQIKYYSIRNKRELQRDFRETPPTHIIVNGEGTFHSDRKAALYWCKIARICQEQNGCRIALVNASWFNNNECNRLIPQCDLIYMRDKQSLLNVLPFAGQTQVKSMPDLFYYFCSDVKELTSPSTETVICNDCVEHDKSNFLRSAGKENKLEGLSIYIARSNVDKAKIIYQTLSKRKILNISYVYEFIKLKSYFKLNNSMLSFIHRISGCSGIVTGRYHMVVLAIVLDIPFVYLDSNTPKIESFLNDVGINGRRIITNDNITIPEFDSQEIEALTNFKSSSAQRMEGFLSDLSFFLHTQPAPRSE